ncbi:MAG: hypothetical protein CBC84_001160 [Pelagibacteraceae bacterium TMED124]|nr:MAG: hypothetical protein CBC84_001160 [Pelagibacteraceae bacterium TMED124]|tara:strand:+ start:9462 stop:10415 length:954 start_codon:yes stop_codon:yes gene_type:complete
MNSKNIIIVDMLSQHGHIPFNKWYLKNEVFDNSLFLIDNELSAFYQNINKIEIDSFENYNYGFKRLIFALKCLKKIISLNRKKIIFVSYDLKFFLLIALVLKFFNKDIYTIEHNTIPDKFSKKLIHYFLSFFVNKIVFTDYIKSIYPNNKYIQVINHPVTDIYTSINSSSKTIEKLKSEKFSKTIFCPSFSSNYTSIKNAALNNPKYLFIIKKTDLKMPDNVFQEGVIDDYYDCLIHCDAVYVPFIYKYRVSNVMYESIGINKILFTEDSKFYTFLKNRKFNIFLISDMKDEYFENKIQNDFVKYNRDISKKISEIF